MKTSLVLLAGVFVVYAVTMTAEPGVTGVTDWIFTAFPAWTLAQHGTLDIDAIREVTTRGWQVPVGDHWRSDRLPGPILLAVPFYWVLGSGEFDMAPAGCAAALSGAVAIFFLHQVLLKVARRELALGAAIIAALATPMWTVTGDQLWTHGPALMGLTGGLWALSSSSYLAAGAGFAFAFFSRPTTVFAAATMGIWESASKRSIVPALKVAATGALGVLALLLYNRINVHEWTLLPGSYTGRGSDVLSTSPGGQNIVDRWAGAIAGSLLSPLRGVLVYSPFLLLLLPGLPRGWRVAPAWVRSAAVGGLVMLVVQLAENSWIGGDGYFGYRVTLEAVVMSVPLLTLCWQEWTVHARWRRLTFAALVLVTMWTFAVASVTTGSALASGSGRSMTDAANWLLPEVLEATDPVVWILAAGFVALVGWLVMRSSPLLTGGPPGNRPKRSEPAPATKAKAPSAAGPTPSRNNSSRNRKKRR